MGGADTDKHSHRNSDCTRHNELYACPLRADTPNKIIHETPKHFVDYFRYKFLLEFPRLLFNYSVN